MENKNERAYRLDHVDSVVSVVFKFLTWVSIIPVVYILFITTADVIARAFFNHSIYGAVQTAQITLSLVVMCAMPIVTMYNTHIKVDLLVERLPKKAQTVLGFVNLLFCAAVMLVVSYFTFGKMASVRAMGTSTDALHIPYWPVYMLIAIMLLLSALCAIYNMVHFSITGTTISPVSFDELKERNKARKAKKEADEG